MPDELTVSIEDLKTGFSRSESSTGPRATSSLHDLPAGHFTVTVHAEGGEKKVEVDLTEGQQKTGVDVTLEELVDITGRVVDLVAQAAGVRHHGVREPGGRRRTSRSRSDDEDTGNITDGAGKFTVKRAPKGALAIQGMAKEWKESDYSWFRALRTVTGSGTVDVGDIGMIKKRIKEGEVGRQARPALQGAAARPAARARRARGQLHRADGPAAKVDVKVGDVITSIDGDRCHRRPIDVRVDADQRARRDQADPRLQARHHDLCHARAAMKQRRRIGLVAGLALVAIALVIWRCRGTQRDHGTGDNRRPGGDAVNAPRSAPPATRRPDPAKLVRGTVAGTVTIARHHDAARGARVCANGQSRDYPDELLREPTCVVTDAPRRSTRSTACCPRSTRSARARRRIAPRCSIPAATAR